MTRICQLAALGLALQFTASIARAETTLDALENELKEVQHQHDEASSKQFNDLLNALDQAMQSPDAAMRLYQSAGGAMPQSAAIRSTHNLETPDEKAQREAQDQAILNALATVVQLHCGVMRYAALFVQKPDKPGLHDEWVTWLKHAAKIYPQAGYVPPDTRTAAAEDPNLDGGNNNPNNPSQQQLLRGKNKNQNNNNKNKDTNNPGFIRNLKEQAVRESVISTYFGYSGWGDKDQGNWSVRDIPALYRTEVLTPLRDQPTTATIAAWDTYIAMKNADQAEHQGEHAKWAAVEYPSLLFQRSHDDFYVTPSDEKLQVMVELVKDYPTHSEAADWISQIKKMIADYRTFKTDGTMPSPGSGSTATTSDTSTPAADSSTPAPTPTPTPADSSTTAPTPTPTPSGT